MELFMSTTELLKSLEKLNISASRHQIVIDSKHRLLHNNYPLSVIGVLDSGQQFHLVAFAISNKEDESMYNNFISATLNTGRNLYPTIAVGCTQSDQSAAVMNALRSNFPDATIGSCLFHLQQNNKRKRLLWNIDPPSNLAKREKSVYLRKKRDELTQYSRDMIAWLSIIPEKSTFDVCCELFKIFLESNNHTEHAQMIEDYSRDGQRGWSRAYMPCGSATTNNALESFNYHALQATLSNGARSTVGDLIQKLKSHIHARSIIDLSKEYPLTPLDIRRTVHVTSQRLRRVKNWYNSAADLRKVLHESSIPFFRTDNQGGFYICAAKQRSSKTNIDELVNRYMTTTANCLNSQIEAKKCIQDWKSESNDISHLSVRDTMYTLKENVDHQYFSFWHVQLIPENENMQMYCSKNAAKRILNDLSLPEEDRNEAQHCISSENFLWFGALSHRCTCPDYIQYCACKHSLWATQFTRSTGTLAVHPRVDSNPLVVRKSAGRPKRTGNAHTYTQQTHIPLFR